jgi:hypothetical protein
MHLEATMYGQFALGLDPTGCLASVTSGAVGKRATLHWLGLKPTEQLTYRERE